MLTRNSSTEQYEVTGELTASPSFGEVLGVAVDTRGDVFVADWSNEAVVEFNPASVEINRISTASALPEGRPSGVAVDAAGDLFVQGYSGVNPVYKWGANLSGEIEPGTVPVEVEGVTGATGVGVDPASNTLFVVSATKVVAYNATTLVQEQEFGAGILSGAKSLAVNSATEQLYVSDGANASVAVFATKPEKVPHVTTEAASAVAETEATLNGSVNPEGEPGTECRFEYGTNTTYGRSAPCSQVLPADEEAHPVSVNVSGLKSDTVYHFRVAAANANEIVSRGKDATFETKGAPQIAEVRARNASQDSATLEAKINPSGFDTTYRFEWGAGAGYGEVVPAEPADVGSGSQPVLVTAALTGLTPGGAYHYRLVASSGEGRDTASQDQIVESLDSCGLPQGRCFELVSPPEVGLVANPGQFQGTGDMHFQAATSGPGAVAYTVENGLTDATVGGEPLYRGTRSSGGWSSTQLSPPVTARSETTNGTSLGSVTVAISDDLSCGVVVSPQPLTNDSGTRAVVEGGGTNLYRRGADGSYTAITKLPPENPVSTTADFFQEYTAIGISSDCSKVVFGTEHHYPGVAGVGTERLYEWNEGTLRNVGVVPGPNGEIAVQAARVQGQNAVSEDGSRVFFSAERQTEEDPLETDRKAIFVREDGKRTRDVSQSQGARADLGASYQYASKDGSRVFFTANAGLTRQTSSEGTDLYEYNLQTEALSDLSIDSETGGADVGGFIGGSEDGSAVYFAARGQLAPGKGMTFAENEAADTYSIYAVSGRNIRYVAAVHSADLARVAFTDLAENTNNFDWTSRVSSDGRYLAFESSAKVTGYESGGAPEAYLFDDDAVGPETTVCVSCRQDGGPPIVRGPYTPLDPIEGLNPLHPQQTLAEHEGQATVFFSSSNKLDDGATEDAVNLYEWAHGQVFLLTSEPTGFPAAKRALQFVGASADGSDLYFATPEALTWEDGDKRSSVYDARIGGGFPEPPAPQSPCEPDSEGSCQGAASSASATASEAASATFSGAGNLLPSIPGQAAKPKPPTRSQKLAIALKQCRKDKSKSKRLSCEKRARKQFGPKPKAKAKRKTANAKRKRGK